MEYYLVTYNFIYQKVPGKIFLGRKPYIYTCSKKLNIRILS